VALAAFQQLWFRVTDEFVPLVVVLAFALAVAATSGQASPAPTSSAVDAVGCQSWTIGLTSALLIWSQMHFWPAVWAAAAASVMFLAHDYRRWRLWIPTFLVLVVLAEFATRNIKSTKWPLFSEEHVYYELLSTSLALRPTDSPLFSSVSGITYHWLSYAFSGWVTRAVDAPEFVVTAGVLPIFFAILAVALLLDNVKAHSSSVRQAAILAVCIGIFGSYMGEGNMDEVIVGISTPSVPLATCAVCGLFLTGDRILAKCTIRATVVGMLLVFAALGSYLAVGLIPVGSVVILLAMASVQVADREVRRRRVLAILALSGAAVASLRIFAGFPNMVGATTARLTVFPLFGFVEELTGEVFVLNGFHRTAAKFAYFAGLITPAVLLAIRPRETEPSGFGRLTRICALLSIVGLTVIQDQSYATSRIFVTSLQYFAIPLLAIALIRQQRSRADVLKSAILGLVVWMIWLLEDERRANLGGPANVLFRALGHAMPALVALVGAGCSVIIWRESSRAPATGQQIRFMGAKRAWSSAAAAVLVFGSLQGVSTSVEAWGMYQPRFEDWGVSYSANNETRRAAQYLKSNSDSTALIAVDLADSDLQLQHFARLSERQMLVIGSSLWAKQFFLDSDAPELLQLQRQLSTPTRDLIRKLEFEGVTHVILRRGLSRRRFLSLVGLPDYESDSWAIYALPLPSDG
jgi:hypothetical protein